MSCTLCSGSMVSGQRRMQGAKTMARALADMRFVSSCSAILKGTAGNCQCHKQTEHAAQSPTDTQTTKPYRHTDHTTLQTHTALQHALAIVKRPLLEPHLTRWKTSRSRVQRCVLLSWSITEYTPRITSFLSCEPGGAAPHNQTCSNESCCSQIGGTTLTTRGSAGRAAWQPPQTM